MKIIQTVTSIKANSAGPSYTVPRLCEALAQLGQEVELHVLDSIPNVKRSYRILSHPRHFFPHPALGRSPEMFAALCEACRTASIIQINGLWELPDIYPYWAKRNTNCKLVTTPRGSLSTWSLAKSSRKKQIIRWFGQTECLKNTDLFIATCEDEYYDIRKFGLTQPVAIIPNGVDIPVKKNRTGEKCSKRLVFLSRIHPKKGLELLLHVWRSVQEDFADWHLSIVGPIAQNPYVTVLKEMARFLGCQRVTFEGELCGEDKTEFLSDSACMVFPTHSENFGMVVAESLACGTPVVCSQGAPWEGMIKENCGWWIPLTEFAFMETLIKVMSMSQEKLLKMGENGRRWIARDFTWDSVGKKTLAAYEWLCHGGERPDCVRLE